VKKLFFIVLICTYVKSTAQNLVPNPSFELYNSCPLTPFFSTSVQNWVSPINQVISFQYFNTCANPSIYGGVPINALGNEMPYSGNAYIAIALGTTTTFESRYYTGVKLVNTLSLNKFYKVSLMYSCSDTQYYANRNFGVLFTNSIVQFNNPFPGISAILPYTPQLENIEFLDNRNGWQF
jgi:OmpA-OmpF porin, OOP family